MKVRKKRPNFRILLVGCGKMGRALGSGWLSSGLDPEKLMAVEPDPSEASEAKSKGIITVPNASEALDNFDPEWIIFCVKPNILNEVAKSYQHLSAKVHYLSIAAGKTLLQLTDLTLFQTKQEYNQSDIFYTIFSLIQFLAQYLELFQHIVLLKWV